MDRLVEVSAGFTGAEIEGAIEAGMYAAFEDRRDVTTEDIVREFEAKEPMSKTDKAGIDKMRLDMRQALKASSGQATVTKSRFVELG